MLANVGMSSTEAKELIKIFPKTCTIIKIRKIVNSNMEENYLKRLDKRGFEVPWRLYHGTKHAGLRDILYVLTNCDLCSL
jgi:hypothetical protein